MADWLHLIYTGNPYRLTSNYMGWYGFSSDCFLQINPFQYLWFNVNIEVYLFVDGESLNMCYSFSQSSITIFNGENTHISSPSPTHIPLSEHIRKPSVSRYIVAIYTLLRPFRLALCTRGSGREFQYVSVMHTTTLLDRNNGETPCGSTVQSSPV